MTRHSKQNNSSSVFTYSERRKLSYGTKQQRISSDSLRSFDSCFICLSEAINPLSCENGHLACKECIFEYILKKKREIEVEKRESEILEKLKFKEEKEKDLEEKEREKIEFLKAQNIVTNKNEVKVENKESSFWIPSKAPENKETKERNLKSQVKCPINTKPHNLNAKRLLPVNFSTNKNEKICPACQKTLTNSLKLILVKKCGHVLCKNCSDKFLQKSCFVCNTKINSKDLVLLESGEGTGFSSRGNASVTKYDLAFKA